MCHATRLALRASACGFHGPTPIRSAGSATRSISAKFPSPICAMKTFELARCAIASTSSLRPCGSRTRGANPGSAESLGPDALQSHSADTELRHARRVRRHHRRHRLGRSRADPTLRRRRRLTGNSGQRVHASFGSGIVRGVRRSSGGVPRSTQGGGADSAAAAQQAATRTPGAHVRVTFDRPDSPLAYGYPAHTHVFRQNFPLYDVPRHWLRMAYCTTCLDGPQDREQHHSRMGRP